MFKTGNAFIDAFSTSVLLLPLLVAGIVFVRRLYRENVLNFLMIVCLLNFCESFSPLLPGLPLQNHVAVTNIFFLLEAIALVRIMVSGPGGPRFKQSLNTLLVALLSVFLTYFVLEGIDRSNTRLDTARDAVSLLIALPVLILLIRGDNLFIFRQPLFWISTGTSFYFAILLLLEWIGPNNTEQSGTLHTGKIVLVGIAALVRYFLYTLAALNFRPAHPDQKG